MLTEDEVGEALPLVEALGMLRFAELNVIEEHNGELNTDDDED